MWCTCMGIYMCFLMFGKTYNVILCQELSHTLKVLFYFMGLLMKIEGCRRVMRIEARVQEVKERASR